MRIITTGRDSSVAYVNVTVNDCSTKYHHLQSAYNDIRKRHTDVTNYSNNGWRRCHYLGWIAGTRLTLRIIVRFGNRYSTSGTPSVLQVNSVAYTVWANNSGGSASTTVNIAINDQIAVISYASPIEISNDRTLTTITPIASGGTVTSWEISFPSLPTGLIFGASNGSIWGVPLGVEGDETYTIWANNSGGSAQATLTLALVWTLTPTIEGVEATRNTTLADDIQWVWDYEPLEAQSISL